MGYNLIGIAFTRVVPLPMDIALNLMSALFAAACVGLVCAIAQLLVRRVSAGIGSAAVLATTYLFLENAVYAELYVMQLCFFLLTVYLILMDRPVLAGLAFASACLVTPSTGLAVPFLVLLRPTRRFVLLWVGVAGAVLAAAVLPHTEGYFYGPGHIGAIAPDLTLLSALAKEAEQIGGFSFALAFALTGVVVLGLRRRYWPFLAGLFLLWLATFLLGERYSDVPVQMPFYSMLAVLSGVGFSWLIASWRTRRAVAVSAVVVLAAALVFTGVSSYREVSQLSADLESYKAAVLECAGSAQSGEVGIGQYYAVVLVNHYLKGESNGPELFDRCDLDGLNGESKKAEGLEHLDTAISSRKRVWLLESSLMDQEDFFASNGYQLVPVDRLAIAVPVDTGANDLQ